MKTKRKLKPYQYKLRFPPPPREPKVHHDKPHIIFFDGRFHVYRNKWKSQFRGPQLWASCISGTSISELQHRMLKADDGYKFGSNQIK